MENDRKPGTNISVEEQEKAVRHLGLSPKVARENPYRLKKVCLNAMMGHEASGESQEDFENNRRVARAILHFLTGRS